MTVLLKVNQTPIVALYSGLAAAGTSMTITPVPADLDGVALTMTDFGNTGYCTIDPKISGYEEIVSFTGLTANGDGTATLTGLTRDLKGKSPYTVSSSGGKIHGSNAVVVFSDNPQIFDGILNYLSHIGGPQGFGYNYKIVRTVDGSGNMIVALKGLDGNDPSASNPIPIRIGDTVRTITGATSQTITAGYNYFNSGSAEL